MAIVSLIITVYDRALYLASAIASVLTQTYPDFELLIWDDGSTDSSLKIAQSYADRDPRIRVIAAPHSGIAPALKSAIAHTTAPYLGWIDSDDILAPTALAETLTILETHSSIGLVYTDYEVIDAQGNNHGLGKRCQIAYSRDRLLVDFMTFHFRLMRREVYDQVGGIDPNYERAEDYDLCLRLSEITEIHHLQRPLYSYRQHSSNATKDQQAMIHWSQQAITAALQRRGMSDRYELHLSRDHEFSLRPKAPPLPLVSIIIPVYNAQETIERCLQSCIQQTYPRLEIIVIDNNSSDQTFAIIAALAPTAPHPIQQLHCPQQGANHTRNHGWHHAQGDYIQWLDADDELDPNKIALQVAALEGDRTYDIATGDWTWCFDTPPHPPTQLTFIGKQHQDDLLQLLLDHWRPPHCCLLRRAAAAHLQHLSAWNPTTRACMDREYFTLAALLGYKFRYVPHASVRYHSRTSSTQITQSTPYRVRVQSLKTIFHRLQQQAQLAASDRLQTVHWFLLAQNWDLWKPAFSIIKQPDHTFWLQPDRTPEKQPLTSTEATILAALLKGDRALSLEDHARTIVRQIWRETIVRLSQSSTPQHIFNPALISQELAKAVGLTVPSVTAPELDETAIAPHHSVKGAADPTATTIAPRLPDLIRAYPLYTPLFGEQRLIIQSVLERVRQQGWLEQPPALSEGINFSELTSEAPAPESLAWLAPDFTNWALAPEALAWIAQFIQTQKIRSVVELGSGRSTLLLATLQKAGTLERSLSIEHDPHWYGYILEQLKQQQLLDYAQVQLSPLEPVAVKGTLTFWYSLATVSLFPTDLILVDGPPSPTAPLARYPALHRLQPWVRKGTWIIIDDYHRRSEQVIVERWLKEFPDLKLVEVIPIDTGLAILSWE